MKNIIRSFLLLVSALILISCAESNSGKIITFVSIQPQKFFVEKIGGDKVDVSVFVKSGMSPENFEPLPSQLVNLSRTDIYFTIGLQFEKILINNLASTNPSLKIIDTEKNIKLREAESFTSIFEKDNIETSEKHNHGLYDPHIWLSPSLIKKQTEIIFKSLSEYDPINKDYYQRNFTNFISELDSAKEIITTNLWKVNNKDILVFHPAWGYFCDEFNLKQIPIELEGKEPGMKDLSGILKYVKEKNSKFILAEAQNSSPALHSIAEELNIKIIKHDPLAENCIQNLISLSEVIRDNN